MKIKSGDRVIVIAGKDKGIVGVVTSTFTETKKVLVEGVNFKTYHKKPSQTNPEGGKIRQEAPIDISNVMYVQGKGEKVVASRLGYKYEINAKRKKEKQRVFIKTGEKV